METAQSQLTQPVLELRKVGKAFQSGRLFAPRKVVVAAEDVSFGVRPGECVALVGESGSGKSTLARMILRLEEPDRGQILLHGEDVLETERRGASLSYRSRVQMVFQDPFGSLNPMHKVAYVLERPLLRHGRIDSQSLRSHSLKLLDTVGLRPAQDFIDRRPYELSGGQRQRVAIARALAVEPEILVADEPTSMLDVSIRMGVLQLLADLKKTRKLALLLITHDLASARFLADRVLVLFRGRVVEAGASDDVILDPKHPYTQALLSAIADPDGGRRLQSTVQGSPETEVTTANTGCPFAGRCADVHEVCYREDPRARRAGAQEVRCHLYPEAGA